MEVLGQLSMAEADFGLKPLGVNFHPILGIYQRNAHACMRRLFAYSFGIRHQQFLPLIDVIYLTYLSQVMAPNNGPK